MPYQDKDPLRTDVGGKFGWKTTIMSAGVKTLLGDDPIAAMALNAFIRCHQNGEWGVVSAEEAAANAQALVDGSPVFSRYHLNAHEIWILTDAEPREITNVLLPDEYEPPSG